VAKLGTEKRPAIFRVQSKERLEEVAAICEENGWQFIGGLESDKPEDISDVEYLLNKASFGGKEPRRMKRPNYATVKNEGPAVGRNDPCPCGSGLKYKKCCFDKE
jgi:SWIM/SEC-C metal-binding protein